MKITAPNKATAREVLSGRGYSIVSLHRISRGPERHIPALLVLILGVGGLYYALPYLRQSIMNPTPPPAERLAFYGQLQGLQKDQTVRVAVSLPEFSQEFHLDEVHLNARGEFSVTLPYPRQKNPTHCSVTIGAEGYAPLSFPELAFEDRRCNLPPSRMVSLENPEETPSPTPSEAPEPEPESPEPSPTPEETPEPVVKGWDKMKFTLKAGVGMEGVVTLGQPIDDTTLDWLGEPTHQDSKQTVWGEDKFLVEATTDPVDGTVSHLRFRGVRAALDNGLYLGAPSSKVHSLLPEAQKETGMVAGTVDFLTAGLVVRVWSRAVNEFQIEPLNERGWRFELLKVEPGFGVGPLRLGQTVTQEALDLLGQPGYRQEGQREQPHSGVIRWGHPGDRCIEVTLGDGRQVDVITSVRVLGVRAITARKVFLGATESKLKRAYPEAREGVTDDFTSAILKLPGLVFVVRDQKLAEMRVY